MNKKQKKIAPSTPHKSGKEFLPNRKDIKQIEAEIVQGVSLTQIGLKYNCSVSSLSRYKKSHLLKKCNAIQIEKDLREGDELLNLLETYINNVNLVSSACLEQLQDPEDPNKLYLGATANDIDVSYTDGYYENGKPIVKKDTLQGLIDQTNKNPDKITVNIPDRAHTLLKASQAMNKHIHLFGELKGLLGNVTINITNQPVFVEFTLQVLNALSEYPEARTKIAQHLRKLSIETVEAQSN